MDGSACSYSEEEESDEEGQFQAGTALDRASWALGRPNWSPDDLAHCKEGAMGMVRFFLEFSSNRARSVALVDFQVAWRVFHRVSEHRLIVDWNSYQQPVEEALSTWRDACRTQREPLTQMRAEFRKRVAILLTLQVAREGVQSS